MAKQKYPQIIWSFKSELVDTKFRVVAAAKKDSFLEACNDWDSMENEIWIPIDNEHVNDLTIAIADYFLQQFKKAKK